MRFPGNRSPASIALAAALLVLLPIVAALQYKWIGEVSNAERERRSAHVRAASARLAAEFNGEVAREFFPLHFSRAALRGSAQHAIIQNFFVAEAAGGGGLALHLWRPDREQFEPAEWPDRLVPLRRRLEAQSGQFMPGFAFADPDIPALIAPRFSPGRPPRFGGWSVAELDLRYIRNDFLPELVQSHFGVEGRLDYRISVVDRADRTKMIYSTEATNDPGGPADATAGLLQLRPEPGRRFRAFLGPPPGPDAPGFRWSEDSAPWQLLVRHRAGSLEAAVAQVRRRNLAVSSFILILMAAGMIMLVISTRRAQRLARLQMEFVAGVSHELKTPLAVICSAGENLADGLVASTKQAQRYGSLIRTEGRRLSEMVDQILGLAGMQIRPEPANLSEVIDRAVAVFEPQLNQSGCIVEKRLAPDLPPVLADSRWLAHAVQNLVSNAIKYGDGKWIGIRSEAAAGQARVHVEDRGPGIDPSDLPHTFEPFYRGRNATGSQIHGVGLGLNLVKRIAEAHGGAVDVKSAPGQGARFTLSLPLAS